MCAVSNVGDSANWCGHHFAAANWFVFGELCWDPDADVGHVARGWLELTFGRNPDFLEAATELMMNSREALVNYMTPLGLHHIMAYDHHQGPGPWVEAPRPDWSSVYYHRADEEGIGFNRTASGSDALRQYPAPYRETMESRKTCPNELLLWYHRVGWDEQLSSGRTLWDELCVRYQHGVEAARSMASRWTDLAPHVDELRHHEVAARLQRQVSDAEWWKDACLAYFQEFSRRPYPEGVEPPKKTLGEYRAMQQYFVPGIPERCFS